MPRDGRSFGPILGYSEKAKCLHDNNLARFGPIVYIGPRANGAVGPAWTLAHEVAAVPHNVLCTRHTHTNRAIAPSHVEPLNPPYPQWHVVCICEQRRTTQRTVTKSHHTPPYPIMRQSYDALAQCDGCDHPAVVTLHMVETTDGKAPTWYCDDCSELATADAVALGSDFGIVSVHVPLRRRVEA